MEIAVIGAGNIGSTLGEKWARSGESVRFGVRKPEDPKYADLRQVGQVVPLGDALEGAEVVVLALPGPAVAEFVGRYAQNLDGKIIIDAANHLNAPAPNSLAVIREKAPHARLARAFNNLGWEIFANPRLSGIPVDLFYCSQPAARPTVEELVWEVGLRPICLGDLDTVHLVDALLLVWFDLAAAQGRGRRIGFKLIEEHPAPAE